jgi:hypothetical protein
MGEQADLEPPRRCKDGAGGFLTRNNMQERLGRLYDQGASPLEMSYKRCKQAGG